MGIFRRGDNRQAITGLFVLVLLAVVAGPRTLPRLISSVFPFADEGVPCEWLKTGEQRDQHQSLIGRAAGRAETSPLSVSVKSSPLPNTPDGKLVITIAVVNTSIGTVPFVYNPRQVIVGENGTSGLGIIFNPPAAMSTGGTRQETGSVPESDIRLLGPRQRCVHKVEFEEGQIDPILGTGTATVAAYYRNNASGQVITSPGPVATALFVDQGLWIGYIESEPAFVSLPSQ